MKRKLSALLLLFVCSTSVWAQGRAPRKLIHTKTAAPARIAGGQQLPIRRVILYSNGVAYIERRGLVSGRAEIDLSFKQSQVDDVLKSMIVLDLGPAKRTRISNPHPRHRPQPVKVKRQKVGEANF